jgi:hypothetical protein
VLSNGLIMRWWSRLTRRKAPQPQSITAQDLKIRALELYSAREREDPEEAGRLYSELQRVELTDWYRARTHFPKEDSQENMLFRRVAREFSYSAALRPLLETTIREQKRWARKALFTGALSALAGAVVGVLLTSASLRYCETSITPDSQALSQLICQAVRSR